MSDNHDEHLFESEHDGDVEKNEDEEEAQDDEKEEEQDDDDDDEHEYDDEEEHEYDDEEEHEYDDEEEHEDDTEEEEAHNDNEEEDDDDDIRSIFTVLIMLDINDDQIPSFLESTSESICMNREKASVIACYAVCRAEEPSSKSKVVAGQNNQTITINTTEQSPSGWSVSMPNIIVKTVCTSREEYEEALNKKENQEHFQGHLASGAYRTFPKFSMWNRFRGHYSASTDPPTGDGTFFMMCSIKVSLSESEEKTNRYLHRLASLARHARILEQGRDEVYDEEQLHPVNERVSNIAFFVSYTAQEALLEEFGNCCCYEVLVSDGPERADEVLVWASWITAEAYLHHTKQNYAKRLADLPKLEKSIAIESTFWVREKEGCQTLDSYLDGESNE